VARRLDSAEDDFESLVAAARTGDASALGRLYAAYAPAVAGFFRMQRADEPEDLTSEVFVGVLRNLRTFTGDEPHFRSWVFTIAYRRLADARRAGSRRPSLQPLDGHDPVDPADVEADVDRLLATRRIRALCATLPPAQRDVLLLRLLTRMTVDEVAAVIGRSRSATKALQRRGLTAVSSFFLEREGAPR
jgi:RNA polymerase sigma-70 factor (ECF subfamily)